MSASRASGGGLGPHQVTHWLRAAASGDANAEELLLKTLYRELHDMARRELRRERPAHTLQPTALLNEAYVRLMRGGKNTWNDRVHFLSVAAKVMRRILVDHARRRAAGKRGAGVTPVELKDVAALEPRHSPERVLAVDAALSELAELEPRQARIVELKFFGGLTTEEIAAFLQVSPRTIKRDWVAAKAWLYQKLER